MSDRAHFQRIGRKGGLALTARHDMRAVAAHARTRAPSSLDYWLERVDPARELSQTDRESRARAAKRLHFVNLAERSARARRKKAS